MTLPCLLRQATSLTVVRAPEPRGIDDYEEVSSCSTNDLFKLITHAHSYCCTQCLAPGGCCCSHCRRLLLLSSYLSQLLSFNYSFFIISDCMIDNC